MATNRKATMTATSMTPPSTGPRRPLSDRMVQNFRLVWLNGNIDEVNNDDCRNSIMKLRHIVNNVNTFTDVDECMDFISDIKQEKIFVIVSGAFSSIIVPVVQDISQVSSVYIFCENKARHEEWTEEWSKVNGVYTDIIPMCEALKEAAQDCDHNSLSISLIKSADGTSNQNLDQLHQSFMYTQILNEILLTIDFQQEHIDEFLTYCREKLVDNTRELNNVDKIEKEYHHRPPIWWYTYQSFLYSMLNRALRTMEVDVIIKIGFFVRDLHNHIAALHAEQYGGYHQLNPFTVYRGQGLSQTDFDQLMKTKGGLLSFNNFLSTSKNHEVSLRFARRTMATSDLVGVLFILKIVPSISATPFANVSAVSAYQTEDEILISMHSVFRIDQIKQIEKNDHLWQVDVTLTSDNDQQLYTLTKSIREETKGSTGWHRLGSLLIRLGQFNKAEELYEILLKQTTNEGQQGYLYHMLGMVKDHQGNYAETVGFYEKSLEIYQKILPANHPDLATSYSNIGLVCYNMGEYSKALSYYEKALEIYQKTFPANHSSLAISYNNIGMVYDNMGQCSKALSYYEKALKIDEKILPTNHPNLAALYNNIGSVYDNRGECSKALSYYEKALKIDEKILPANHPDLAGSYNNIGLVCCNMGEYSKALSSHEKALEIFQKTFSANSPRLATSYNNIGLVYHNIGAYSKALPYYERALDIRQRSLPRNHPDIQGVTKSIQDVKKSIQDVKKKL